MKAAIFFYVAAARLLLDEPILLIRPTEHISSTSMPYYTFTEEYCIPEDKNLAIQIRLVYNGWNHFTPFFPHHVADIIRKGKQILRRITNALDGLKELAPLISKKCLLKNGIKDMLEHLEAADTIAKTCNFKFGMAEIQVSEEVALPRNDRIITGHSCKHHAPVEKGCKPSPKKTATATTTTATITTAATVTSSTVTTTSTTTTTATAASQITTRSKIAVASTSTGATSTGATSTSTGATSTGATSTSTGATSTGATSTLAHWKSIHLPALQCVCGKIFETKHFLNLHIAQKHKENFSCSGKVFEDGKQYDCSFVSTDRNSMWTHFRTIHLNIWCNYCVVPMCNFGWDELSAVLKHQHDKHGMDMGLTCTKCKKVFSQSGKLKDHMMTCKNKEWPFVCQHCGQDFWQRTELNIHLRQQHPKTPSDWSGFFKCPNCTKEFRTYSGRRKHVNNCKK